MAVKFPPASFRLRQCLQEHPDGAALAFFLAVTLVLFLKYLDPRTSQVLSRPGDISNQFIWWREFGFGELRQGHLALWNPHLFCGVPYFAGFQSALLYPFNWIFPFLPLAFAMNLSMSLHVFLAGWFTYLWVRKRGHHPASAVLAALIYMFSGAFFVRIVVGHLSNLCSMTWIPLVFWALEGWKTERKSRWIAWGALALALQFLSGHIQYAYYTAVAVAFYAAVLFFRVDRKFQFVGGAAAAYGAGALLAAVQLLAGWDAVKESLRAGGLGLDLANMANLDPERLCTFLVPYFFGGWRDYWGGVNYCEGHLFVTVTGFILALGAWKAAQDPERKIFTCLAIGTTLLMLGKRTPLFGLFYKFFPLFDRFRGVSKFNALLALFIALLAAMTHDALLREPGILRGFFKPLRAGGGLFLIAAAVFFLAPRAGGARLFRQYLVHAPSMAYHLFLTGIFLVALAFFCRRTADHPRLKWGFLLWVAAECLFFAYSNLYSFDLNALRRQIAPIQETYNEDPGDYRVCTESGDYTLGAPSGLDVWGDDPMILSRFGLFVGKAVNHGMDHIFDDISRDVAPPLGLLRLRYVFSQEGDSFVRRRTAYPEAPRAFLTGRWEVMKWEDILNKITEKGFDPVREVLLETDPGLGPPSGEVQGRIVLKDLSTDQVEVTVDTPRPSVLVITDNTGRGWKARPLEGSDQKVFSILPAYGFLRAVPLLAGHHHFLMEYRPAAFVVGAWVSLFSWLAFFGFWALQGLKIKRRGHANI